MSAADRMDADARRYAREGDQPNAAAARREAERLRAAERFTIAPEAIHLPGDPEVATLAGYVLGHAEGPRGQYVPPGDFYAALLEAMFRADRTNRARLSLGFPMLGAMVNAYKNDYDGVARLRAAVETGEWS